MKTHRSFLVDTVQDEREMGRALRGLRAVARMGRLAESVLRDIEANGHSERRAPWLSPTRFDKHFYLRYSRFPRIPSISREDVPGYGRLVVRTCDPMEDKVGRRTCHYYDVIVRMPVPGLHSGFLRADVKVGRVRVNYESASFYPQGEEGSKKPTSIPLFRNVKPSAAKSAARAVAQATAGRGELSRSPFASVYLRSLSRWLVEDGHAASFLSDLREFADRHRTVSHVLRT